MKGTPSAPLPTSQSCVACQSAPADLRKEGPAYDLPIAVGVLIASQQAVAETERVAFVGELALDGNVRHAHGVLTSRDAIITH